MILDLGPWEPDRSDLQASDGTVNALPHPDGWQGMPSLEVYNETAVPGVVRGSLLARNLDGSYAIFVATATRIYVSSGMAWTNVTRLVGGDYNLPDGDSWFSFQFGNKVYFGNINDDLQEFELFGGANFIDRPEAPRCRYGDVSGDYALLASTENFPMRVHRSGARRLDVWVHEGSGSRGERGADYQDFQEGGWIRGLKGFERGAIIFQDEAIRTMEDAPGSALLFTLSKSSFRGLVAPSSLVAVGTRLFYRSEDGFYEFGAPEGRNLSTKRMEKWFLRNVDLGDLHNIQGAPDPSRQIVWWRARSQGLVSLDYADLLVGYDWSLDRWFRLTGQQIEWLLSVATPGYTLDELDTVLGYTNLETLPYSLDSRIWKGGRPTLGAFNSAHKLCFFEGDNMAATLEGASHMPGGRVAISGFRPVGSIPYGTVTGQIGTSEIVGEALAWKPAQSQNSTGLIPAISSGRVLRPRLEVAAQPTAWDVASIEVPPENMRAAGR